MVAVPLFTFAVYGTPSIVTVTVPWLTVMFSPVTLTEICVTLPKSVPVMFVISSSRVFLITLKATISSGVVWLSSPTYVT